MEDVRPKTINRDDVNKFWNWFQTKSDDLLAAPTQPNLISEIDNWIYKLGPFDWELGPHEEKKLFFAVSPNLDKELLLLTRQIINLAPACDNWVFLPSKPVKNWEGIFKMKNQLDEEIVIDSTNWKYILYRF